MGTLSVFRRIAISLLAALSIGRAAAHADEFSQPWKNPDKALVIDAYEYNPVDWEKLIEDKRIVGFINKASDGLAPPYFCSGDADAVTLCKNKWRRHAVTQELYQTRRQLAKALGLKWGAYHLGRPGNPIEQANNFISFARPGPDDLMAIDIEENDPSKWMSLADAETFVQEVERRTGRLPILYTNGNTAKYIADNRSAYPILSRLQLWYARYKPEIGMHFPKGNWDSYALWQFSSQANCNKRSCPYRVAGAKHDIDVNVASMTAAELRAAWPLGGMVSAIPGPALVAETVPLPLSREKALAGETAITFASVGVKPGSAFALARAFFQAGERYPKTGRAEQSVEAPTITYASLAAPSGAVAALDALASPEAFRGSPEGVDMMITGASRPSLKPALPFRRNDFPVFLLKPVYGIGQDVEDLLRWPRQDDLAPGNDNRPLDQDWMGQH